MTFSKLGTDTETNQPVYLPKSARTKGLYIIGLQGMGKSGLMENLIMQDIKQQIGVCVLDPKRELIDNVIARLEPKQEKDVVLLDIRDYQFPFGLNLVACSDPSSPLDVQEVTDHVRHIFEKLLGVSEETQLIIEYLYNCTHTLAVNPGYTMADMPLLLRNKNCRQKLVARVTDIEVLGFWEQYEQKLLGRQSEEIASTIRRVNQLLQPILRPLVGQAKTTIDFRAIMDERKILLVKLDRTMKQSTTIVGSIIVALILKASASRQTQRPQFHLYADEFQRFATEDFATLLEEARYADIGITMAHQNRAQLELSEKQADKNLKARTLNVDSLIVFRVPTDADELAGQFDTTPPPAWEEELEEERLEIREQERLEMMEVIDGEEEIDTPVKDVVGHLLRGGEHPSPEVNEFALGILPKINKYGLQGLNTLLFKAMIESPILVNDFSVKDFLVGLFYNGWEIYSFYPSAIPEPDFVDAFYTAWRSGDTTDFYDIARGRVETLVLSQLSDELSQIQRIMLEINKYDFSLEELLPLLKQQYYPVQPLKNYIKDASGHLRITPPIWFTVDLDRMEWEEIVTQSYDKFETYEFRQWRICPNQEWKCYEQSDFDAVVDQIFRGVARTFEDGIAELKAVCQALADEPIYTGSGIRQPRKRQQVLLHPEKTFPHPRVAITHPQQSRADKEKEIAGQLVHLQKFTAWVKIGEAFPQNPGKKCLKCELLNNYDDEYCYDCGTQLPAPNEYIIETAPPEKGLYGKSLQERVNRIQAQNRKPDQFGYVYCRSLQEVEAEITQRQTSCSGGSASAQPQQQARHARTVSVQGKCPNCGKSNLTESKFCNQCGAKLK